MNEEYLKLFEKIKKENKHQPSQPEKMMRETPDYSQLQNLNEVKRQPQKPQDFNMNEFNIETRVNGQSVNNLNEANPNGLNHLIGDENLNEIKRHKPQHNVNEVMQITEKQRLQKQHLENLKKKEKEQQQEKLNEVVNFKDVDIVTLDMFNKANYNSMMQVAQIVCTKNK